jgi:hypothetical protein
MEGNSIGQNSGADPPGQPPEEKKRLDEQLDLIEAAMMVRLILDHIRRSHLIIEAIGRSRGWPRRCFTTRR